MLGAGPVHARHGGHKRTVDRVKRNFTAAQIHKMAARMMFYGRLIRANGACCRVSACDVQVPGIRGSLPASFSETKFGGLPSIDVLHRTSGTSQHRAATLSKPLAGRNVGRNPRQGPLSTFGIGGPNPNVQSSRMNALYSVHFRTTSNIDARCSTPRFEH